MKRSIVNQKIITQYNISDVLFTWSNPYEQTVTGTGIIPIHSYSYRYIYSVIRESRHIESWRKRRSLGNRATSLSKNVASVAPLTLSDEAGQVSIAVRMCISQQLSVSIFQLLDVVQNLAQRTRISFTALARRQCARTGSSAYAIQPLNA